MNGKVVFEGNSKKGNHIIIRYPTMDDSSSMCDYINTLSDEKTFITFQGEKMNLEEEKEYVKKQLERINNKKSVQLLVFCNGLLIGNSQLDMKDRVSKHEGVFGISIAKDFRGDGIGKILMQHVLDEAQKNLADLRIVTLGVFANNPLAIEMYKNFGFQESGKIPKGIYYKGEYIDHIFMYKFIKGFE